MLYGRIEVTFAYNLHWESMILEDSGLQGGGQRRVKSRRLCIAGAVVWQWVATFKEATPPPPPTKHRCVLFTTNVMFNQMTEMCLAITRPTQSNDLD